MPRGATSAFRNALAIPDKGAVERRAGDAIRAPAAPTRSGAPLAPSAVGVAAPAPVVAGGPKDGGRGREDRGEREPTNAGQPRASAHKPGAERLHRKRADCTNHAEHPERKISVDSPETNVFSSPATYPSHSVKE